MLLATTITLLFALQLATRCTSSVIPGAYIIEYADDNANNHDNFLSSLGPLSSLFKVQRTYSSPIFNGVSIRLTDTSAEEPKISRLKGGIVSNVMKHPVLEHLLSNPAVGKIYPVNEVPRPKFFKRAGVAVPQELPYPDDISQLKTIRERFNLRGSGITIGILDSGEIIHFWGKTKCIYRTNGNRSPFLKMWTICSHDRRGLQPPSSGRRFWRRIQNPSRLQSCRSRKGRSRSRYT